MTTESNLQKEIWKLIKGYEGLYEISNEGRVKSLSNNRILRGSLTNGYTRHTLCKDGIKTSYSTSRLVASHFLPENEKGNVIRYKDGNTYNNAADNLEWESSKKPPKQKPEPLQLEGEIWEPVKDFECEYEVSNLGRVKSLPVLRVSPKTGMEYRAEEKILKQPKRVGYYSVAFFCPKESQKGMFVHRLIAETFIPNPDNKPHINHINGIKTDNRISNLEWCTPKENAVHAHETGLSTYKGEKHHLTPLTKEDVIKIRQMHKTTNLLHREIAEKFGVTRSSISSILKRKTWKHI